jgi:hypothetical protein
MVLAGENHPQVLLYASSLPASRVALTYFKALDDPLEAGNFKNFEIIRPSRRAPHHLPALTQPLLLSSLDRLSLPLRFSTPPFKKKLSL